MNDDISEKIKGLTGNDDVGQFVQNYRNALDAQYQADTNALANQRKLDHTTIMSNANTRGLLHSSFPTISKLQYDVGTYEPSLIKTRQSYQSGLDTLYSNVAKYYNQIKSLQKKIADLNSGYLS